MKHMFRKGLTTLGHLQCVGNRLTRGSELFKTPERCKLVRNPLYIDQLVKDGKNWYRTTEHVFSTTMLKQRWALAWQGPVRPSEMRTIPAKVFHNFFHTCSQRADNSARLE